MNQPCRYIARFDIEAETVLAVGNGETDITTDQPVFLDANGLPAIPGTALAGVLRHAHTDVYGQNKTDAIFGGGGAEGKGSRLSVSTAVLLDSSGAAVEGLLPELNNPYLVAFTDLPVRDHCRITHRGAADTANHGKFDRQVVFAGARFRFELELSGMHDDSSDFLRICSLIASGHFRIGSGTRKGAGAVKLIAAEQQMFDLTTAEGLSHWLERDSSLNSPLKKGIPLILEKHQEDPWPSYRLNLHAEDFYLFSSGIYNNEADIMPKLERKIDWSSGIPVFKEAMILIPAASVKGALRHRTAFHYNRLTENWADGKSPEELTALAEQNEAVKNLFGYGNDGDTAGARGNVILSDVYRRFTQEETKILNHVAIDRFTGGAMDSALFGEKVIAKGNDLFELTISVNPAALENLKVKAAFEAALKDICSGMLPLGGGVNRGHGVFEGQMTQGKD